MYFKHIFFFPFSLYNVYLIVITGEYFKTKSRFEIAVLVDTVNMLRHFLSVSIDCSAEPE
jgi:hypothetical protein